MDEENKKKLIQAYLAIQDQKVEADVPEGISLDDIWQQAKEEHEAGRITETQLLAVRKKRFPHWM